jgi:hypothetical protein
MGDPKRKAMRKSERAAARNRRAAADAVERESWGVTLGTFSGWTRCELTEADRTEGLTGNKAYCPFSCCFRRHGFTRVIVTAYTVELDGQRAMLPDPLADLLKNLDAGEPVKLPHKFRVPMIPVAQREANKNGDVFPPGFSRYAGLASATLFTPPPRQPIPDWPTEVDDVEPDKALAVDSAFAALQRKQAEAFGNAESTARALSGSTSSTSVGQSGIGCLGGGVNSVALARPAYREKPGGNTSPFLFASRCATGIMGTRNLCGSFTGSPASRFLSRSASGSGSMARWPSSSTV